MARLGSREISNVVVKEIATGKPVLYLETLTVSSMEQTAEAVYARGGRGNPKRIMWESDKEIMYNMTDALISPESLAMLLGTDPVASASKAVHKKESLVVEEEGDALVVKAEKDIDTDSNFFVFESQFGYDVGDEVTVTVGDINGNVIDVDDNGLSAGDRVIVDYYYLAKTTTMTVEVDAFPGYYMLEAETLWTREHDGALLPAVFTMPRVKFASNFSIENAATGDPATFDFNAECFPDAQNQMVVIDVIEGDAE